MHVAVMCAGFAGARVVVARAQSRINRDSWRDLMTYYTWYKRFSQSSAHAIRRKMRDISDPDRLQQLRTTIEYENRKLMRLEELLRRVEVRPARATRVRHPRAPRAACADILCFPVPSRSNMSARQPSTASRTSTCCRKRTCLFGRCTAGV